MLTNISIKNFKCFLREEVSFKRLTVFTGANGVGKSTVIQALLLLRQTIDKLNTFSLMPVEGGFRDCNIKLNGPFMLSLGNADEIINANSKSNIIEFSTKFNTRKDFELFFEANENSQSIILDTEQSTLPRHDKGVAANEFHYLNAERLGPRNVQDVVDQDYIATGYQGEYTGQAIAKAETQNLKLAKGDARILLDANKDTIYSLRKQIELWMAYLIPNIQLKTEHFPKINTVRVSLRNEISHTDFLHPNNIGFGITYSLPIVVSGLIAKPNCILIVENPEAHLHPSGQSRLGQFLAYIAAAGVQVAVETHSEHIINGIRLACLKDILSNKDVLINFFSLKENISQPKIEAIKVGEKGDLSNWPNGFFDQEEQDLDNIFKLKRK